MGADSDGLKAGKKTGEKSDSEGKDKDNSKSSAAGTSGTKETNKTANNNRRKGIGNLWQNIKGAFNGSKKDIIILRIKAIVYPILAILIFFALIVEGDSEETSKVATDTTASVYANSTTESAELYNKTGSLILATDEELDEITTNYLEVLERTNEGYYYALSAKYSGKEGNTVANRVAHITTNFSADETEEVDIIKEKPVRIEGEATSKDEKTIYEHILNTEKYNFNNIIWRSYVKSGGGVTSAAMDFQVDDDSNLKYPVEDTNATNNEDLDLEFFITKVRPYLQSWYIPFDLIVGTQDAQSTANLNSDLAYEIITSAYHEIALDRYKIETLARTTNYLVYDKITTTESTIRTCADYKKTTSTDEVVKKAGAACTKAEYNAGLCKDATRTLACKPKQIEKGEYGCSDKDDSISCNDYPTLSGCSYGVLKKDKVTSKATSSTQRYCTDSTETKTEEVKDIREAKVKTTEETDKLTYSWSYVISMAKMFDKVISNKYLFEPYYEYPLTNYNSFILKRHEYKDMTVEEYRKSEEENAHADSITFEEKDYFEEDVTQDTAEFTCRDCKTTKVPIGYVKVNGTEERFALEKKITVTKVGKEYTDKYAWSDNLKFDESKSGIYNVDSVRDVTGDDLTSYDEKYYTDLYNEQDINLVDLMNSDNELYENYVEEDKRSASTNNIGIRKGSLDISYNVLKKDLTSLAQEYPLSGLMYGNSLDILEGLNLGMIAGAGGVNEALITVASAHLGYNLDQMLALNTYGTFFRNHWCAMFVSYCMRSVEEKTGIKIPIPTYAGCTTIWQQHNSKPGFFDVKEWVENNPVGKCVQTDPEHIAPMSAIQPGDIILYSWNNTAAARWRDHTALVKTVEKDEQGNVIAITTIDGNLGGSGLGEPSYNYSKVKEARHSIDGGSVYTNLSSVASFISVSTVLAEAEKGNMW